MGSAKERGKNFRSIRRGIQQVAAGIEAATFGNTYHGSSLEAVVLSIAEQHLILCGADHRRLGGFFFRVILKGRSNSMTSSVVNREGEQQPPRAADCVHRRLKECRQEETRRPTDNIEQPPGQGSPGGNRNCV